MMVKVAMFVVFAVVNVGFAQELPNPPVAHDGNTTKEETQKGNAQKEQEAKPPPPPPAVTIPIITPIVSTEVKQEATPESTDKSKNVTQESKKKRMWPTPTWAAVIVASVSALATIAYVVISCWQWQTLRDSIDVMRDQNRPWIMITPESPEGWPPEGPPSSFIRFIWTAKNVGKNPAFLTGMWTRIAVVPVPKGPLEYGRTGEFAKFLIAPDGIYESQKDISLNESQLADLTAGRKCLMFYGVVFYDDTFNHPHETCFCSYWWSGVLLNRIFAHVGPTGTTKYT